MVAQGLHHGNGTIANGLSDPETFPFYRIDQSIIESVRVELGKKIDVPYTATYVFLAEGARAIGD